MLERAEWIDLSVCSLRAGTGQRSVVAHAKVSDPVRLVDQGLDGESWKAAVVTRIEAATPTGKDVDLTELRARARDSLDEIGIELTGLWRAEGALP